jgi:nucleoside-diphosphate-sugar epimerase
MKSRLVSVTGATGFLGTHLVQSFQRAGWRVRAIVRPGGLRPPPPGAEVRVSLLEHGPLAAAFDGSDAIVHAAGLTRARNRADLDLVNVGGTRAVVEAANSCQARLVHVSSQAAAGVGTVSRPAREADRPRPVNAYGRSKLASETVLRERSMVSWMIVRPAAVYGPGDRQFLPLLRLAKRGMFPLLGSPTFAFTLVYVEDVARAIVLAAESDAVQRETVFIGHAEPQFGRTYRPFRVPVGLTRIVARCGDAAWRFGCEPVLDSARLSELTAEGFVCAVDRARHALGFTAEVPLPEGLAQTVRWYRDRGWV